MDIDITKQWNSYLLKFNESAKDVYFTEEYVKLYNTADNEAECFVYTDDEKIFLFPYIKSRISIADAELYDFETAYGYGGPLTNTDDVKFITKAWSEFCESCSREKIVCGFVRFHPLLLNHSVLNSAGKENMLSYERKTVAMDLSLSAQDIWQQEIHPKHRNSIRIAERKGLSFVVDEKFEKLNEFIEIYSDRMKALGADESYYFHDDYYKKLRDTLFNNSFLGLVYYNKVVISAAIFLHYGCYGHYHLSGSRNEYQSYRPNNILLYGAALYLKEKNIKLFHLGGGTSGDIEDSLFKFKKRFSKSIYEFYTGKLIFNKKIYDDMSNKWMNKYPDKVEKYGNYFLRYRY